MNERVLVLILNYNGGKDTVGCVASLLKGNCLRHSDIVVIDNHSSDDSAEVISEAFPSVNIVRHASNLGYAEGFNKVVEKYLSSDIEWFLLMNNDTVIHEKAVPRMIEDAEGQTEIGIVGPAILEMDTDRVQSCGVIVNWNRGQSTSLDNGKKYEDVNHTPVDVDYVTGCSMLVRREVFVKVGAFPKHFFMYGEEEDFCLRAARKGYRIQCNPNAVVEHRGGATANRYLSSKERLITCNRFLIMKRHATLAQFILFFLWMVLVESPVQLSNSVRARLPATRLFHLRLLGVIDGLTKMPSESRLR